MDEAHKEDLLAQFRTFLETQPPLFIKAETQSIDLYSLYSELVALKAGIKQESQQFKAALDLLKSLINTHQEQVDSELQRYKKEQMVQQRETIRALLLDFLAIRDRLEKSKDFFRKYQVLAEESFILASDCESSTSPSHQASYQKSVTLNNLQAHLKTLKKGLWQLGEGQAIILRQLDQTLNRYRVQPLAVQHKPLDLQTMRVVEVDNQSDLAEGMVIEEMLKGFLWEDEILRLAEVKVNKPAIKT